MQEKKLKKIDRGWQYAVYDLGKRVLKVPNSRSTIKRIMLLEESPKITLNPKKLREIIDKLIKDREKGLKLLKKHSIKLKILGNPKIRGENIEQDKVIVLREVLKKSKTPQKYIDKFVNLIFECWKHGFSEKVYNLTINNGVNKKGEVVLIDFGEITFDKKRVKKDILNKRWEKARSFKSHLPSKLKKYYKKEMEKHITLKNLDKYWKK